VTTADFTPVSASFNRQAGQANYNFFADFTGDGRVTTADFTPMSDNFNRNISSIVDAPWRIALHGWVRSCPVNVAPEQPFLGTRRRRAKDEKGEKAFGLLF
jgi:hypothetical protein